MHRINLKSTRLVVIPDLQSILTIAVAAATRPAIDEHDKQEFLAIAEFARNGLAAIRGLRRARTK